MADLLARGLSTDSVLEGREVPDLRGCRDAPIATVADGCVPPYRCAGKRLGRFIEVSIADLDQWGPFDHGMLIDGRSPAEDAQRSFLLSRI